MIHATETGRIEALISPLADLDARSEQVTAGFEALCERAAAAYKAARAKRIDSIPPTVRRVLIVDDDREVCAAAERIVRSLDCEPEVDFASSVAMASAKLAEQAYHVLVVDWQLANGHAGDVIRAAYRALPLAWVVLTSGKLTAHDGPRMARTLGAKDWLRKPFQPGDLKYVVGKGLGQFDDPRGPVAPTRNERPFRPLKLKTKRGRD